jgi:hypothetical protein
MKAKKEQKTEVRVLLFDVERNTKNTVETHFGKTYTQNQLKKIDCEIYDLAEFAVYFNDDEIDASGVFISFVNLIVE